MAKIPIISVDFKMDLCFFFSFFCYRDLEQLSPGCNALEILYLLEVPATSKQA